MADVIVPLTSLNCPNIIHVSTECWPPEVPSLTKKVDLTLPVQLETTPLRGIKFIPHDRLLDGEPNAQHKKEEEISFSGKQYLYRLVEKCIHKKDLRSGNEVYRQVVKNGLESDSFIGCHLIRMFMACKDLRQANEVFNGLWKPNVFAWGAIITAHVHLGCSDVAVELYFHMRNSALEPDGHVFVAVLQACSSLQSLTQGLVVHDHIIESGLEFNIYVGNALIDMYCKCRKLKDASILFHRLPYQNAVNWNSLVVGYVQHGYIFEILQLFNEMLKEGFQPNIVSFICSLNACSSCLTVEQGREMHLYFIMHGFDSDIQVGIALMDMYIKCDHLSEARMIFDSLDYDSRACESISAAYFQHECDEEVLKIFHSMRQNEVIPNINTFISVLRACASMSALEQGWQVHSEVVAAGYEYDLFVGNTLVDLYGKCGSLSDAEVVFEKLQQQDVVSWSALISGFSLHEHRAEAIRIFRRMHEEGVRPNDITFASVLKSCCIIAFLEDGRWIHSLVIDCGFGLDTFIGSALVDMYAKCGNMDDACVVMQSLPEQDLVTWNALITGYALHGYGLEALQCFQAMQSAGKEPSSGTLVGVLKACASVAALEQGKQLHKKIVQKGLEIDTFIGTALIDMYAKCGSVEDACGVFRAMPQRDIVAWNTFIACFAQHNDYKSALKTFREMQEAGIETNEGAFLGLLSACSHSGMLSEGCEHFKSMRWNYGIAPTLEHYYSLLDLFGHKACFDEAEDLIESAPFCSNIVGWMSLLTSCGQHSNVELGKRCFDHVIRIKPGYSSGYALMWNLYSQAGMLDEARKINDLRIAANAWKKPAKSFIEANNKVYSFSVADKTHPRSDDIYQRLKTLSDGMKKAGYSPRVDVLPDWSFNNNNKNKEDALCWHSEKLAIAFGLISTPKGSTIRLSKNLRICADCHSAAKVISKLEMREIIIADAYQIHCFKDGKCSCLT